MTTHAQMQIATLQVGTETYQNVIITSRTADSIFLSHSRGFANVKVADLGPEILAKLGYDTRRIRQKPRMSLAWANLPIDPRLIAIKDQFTARIKTQVEGQERNLIATAWCVLLISYLFFCYGSLLICEKAGGRPGIAVWIPVLQFLPLLKAAGMSAAWFILALLPLATPLLVLPVLKVFGPAFSWVLLLPFASSVLTYLIWSVKICRARGIGTWGPVFLVLPWTNLIAFFYLAFSSAGVKLQTTRSPATVRHAGHATDTAFFLQA